MATSKKLYVAVASIIAAAYRKAETDPDMGLGAKGGAGVALREVAVELAREFAADNPRFDTNRFLTACGF